MNRRVYAAVLAVAMLLALGVSNVWYINRVDRESSHQICRLIIILDEAYSRTPPTTELGRSIAQETHAYRLRLGC
jgi:hypothetical protein